MKNNSFDFKKWFFLFLLSAGIISLVTACGSQSSPASPSVPAPTNTPGSVSFTNTPTYTFTPTNTPNMTLTPIPAGAVAFNGWVRNASNQIGFVTNASIAAGVTLYITNLSWDSTYVQFSDQSQVTDITTGTLPPGPVTEVEEVISYVVSNGGLAANTAVVIGRTEGSTITDNLRGGTVTNVALFANTSPSGTALTTSASELGSPATLAAALNFINGQYANGGHLFAYTVPAGPAPSATNHYFPSGSAFTTGLIFGPDAFTAGSPAHFYDSALPPGLTLGANAVDLSGLYANMATVMPTPWATAVNGSGTSGNNIDALVSSSGCPAASAGFTNTSWVGTILGHTHLCLYPQGDANSGVTVCGSGFGFTTPTVTPVAY